MTPHFEQDFFSLFGLPRTFRIDVPVLERAYLDLQAQVHPDRFAHLSDSEKRLSMQWATRVNEGYQTLKDPLKRAVYLLSLQQTALQAETNTAMPPVFLMEQMEWREAVEEARSAGDVDELDALLHRSRLRRKAMVGELEQLLDDTRDYAGGAELARKLMFVEKLEHDIAEAIEALEQ